MPIFFSCLRFCIKHDIDTIINTQNMGTSAIVKALRFIKWWKGKKILHELVLTDLPTKEAQHFFRALRSLSSKDRELIRVLSMKPLLENGETESLFWEKQCNLTLDSISYAKLPLRPAFFESSTCIDLIERSEE